MDQTLDLQVAALIFLDGTRCLVTGELAADVETTSDNEEEPDEPAPIFPIAIELPPVQTLLCRDCDTLGLSNLLTMSVKGESGHRGTMNDVSAVRVLTLFAIASLAAGGWIYQYNGTDPVPEETNELNFDSAMATESGDSDDEAEGARAPMLEAESDDSVSTFSDLSFGLIAGGAGTLGSLTIAASVSEAIRVTVLVALLAPMLAMRGNGDDLLTRGRILGYLEANAGIHFSAMRDALGLANGVTAYHLHVLESQGEVISWRDGKLRRYAIASLSREEVGRIRNPIIGTRLAILEVIANSGNVGISGTEVRKKLEISRQLLSHHIRELRNAGMVEAAAGARRPPWRLSEEGQLALLSSLSVSSSEAAT